MTINLRDLTGKDVEVIAHGIVYRGKLIEVGEEQIYLKGQTGWISLETSWVETIRESPKVKKE
jgi:hypothetical protein